MLIRCFRTPRCCSTVRSFCSLVFHCVPVETSGRFETIISNVLRIHRNYAERASCRWWKLLCNTCGKGWLNVACQLCNDNLVANWPFVPSLADTKAVCAFHTASAMSRLRCMCASDPVKMNPPLCFGFPGQPCLTERQ